MRARYGAEGVFPRVFAKTRPEVWPCLGLVDDAPLRRALAPAPHPRPAHPSTPPPLVPSHPTPLSLITRQVDVFAWLREEEAEARADEGAATAAAKRAH